MWASAIPLVTLLGVVFGAGLVVAEVRAIRRDFKKHEEIVTREIDEIKRNFAREIHDLKRDFQLSAKDQGKRIGSLEAERLAQERAEGVRRELTGKHRVGARDE